METRRMAKSIDVGALRSGFAPVRRFIDRSSRWMWVSVALALISGYLAYINGLVFATVAILMLVSFGLLLEYEHTEKVAYNQAIVSLRKALYDYQRLINPSRDDASAINPISLIDGVMSKAKKRNKAWSTLAEKTRAIHHILLQQLDERIQRSNRFDPSMRRTKRAFNELHDQSWRTFSNYHENVICELLKMRTAIVPRDETVRQDFSIFRKLYDDVVKEIQAARAEANSELGFSLDTEIRNLTLPEP